MSLTIATRLEEARRGRGEDRIAIVESFGRKLVVVADGAGGVGGGAATAEALCHALTSDVTDFGSWLEQQDAALAAKGTGLAAAVVLSITDDGAIQGVSVGDCEAWIFTENGSVNLTERQVRKPLLGDGAAITVSFTAHIASGTIVIASDGLWKYVSPEGIANAAALRPLETSATELINFARLQSGALQDDIAIVIFEVAST
jgi:serine/threonine protein phosphatase PrpC